MTTRRDFLKTVSLAGGAAMVDLRSLSGQLLNPTGFRLNEFIETHPDAVFILRTNVDVKTNAAAIKTVGYQLGHTLFVPGPFMNSRAVDDPVVIKPNVTAWAGGIPPLDFEQIMGIQTDPNFVEGVIQSLRELGISNKNMYMREANFADDRIDGQWYHDMAKRAGVNFQDFPPIGELPESAIQWIEVPNGVWYSRIPYLAPVNSPLSTVINIAKFKSHGMGMTLCSKNLQGTNARPYVMHCTQLSADYGVNPKDIVPNARATIQSNYERHRDAGIPRWDLPGEATGGLCQETHASRCLDNNSVIHPLINIVEGVYGREGSHVAGPSDNGGLWKRHHDEHRDVWEEGHPCGSHRYVPFGTRAWKLRVLPSCARTRNAAASQPAKCSSV